MIPRYTLPEMVRVWSQENRLRKWLEVELAVCDVLAERGEIPAQAARAIREKADFSLERVQEIERETRHDVIAFTTALAEVVGPESRFIHFGLTSTDVVDTAQAMQIREASDLIEAELLALMGVLKRRAFEHRDLPMIGRTHGIQAEPLTFGLKLAVWYAEMERSLERFRQARKNLEVGKISGPVGAFSYLDPGIEEAVCGRLGLDFARASTQTLQRDRHAQYISVLAILASSYDKMATEIRHLQRTEVREASEAFACGQKGSSSMPHKRNPITCEQISGLARVLRGNAVAALENVPLWHERDISHSSVERIILADSTTLAHYLSVRLREVLDTLVVDPERMQANLNLTGGLIFSGTLLLELTRRGVLREEAYGWIQRNAMRAWDEGLDFRELILQDRDIARHMSREEIERAFDIHHKLRHVRTVFERVFGDS